VSAGWSRDGVIQILQNQPLPAQVTVIGGNLEIGED
jgi:hypothetical protein